MIVKGSKINDRYQIIKTLGEGGMANVYLAHDTILDRNVAVKVLRGDLATDEKFIRRFQREALSASSLSHPNIVEMYDVGEDDGQYYIVMEFVDGKTLKQVLKQRGHLSVSEVIDIMSQLADGMAHAHDAYIIHRDIKPQNIMILSNGMIKITDFGVATALNSTQLTQTNSVMGTVHYLPPEQAQGKGSTIRSDIYSMGIMMYELLSGLVPYKGDNAVEIALKHLKEPLPSIRKVNSSIPQSIENVIIRATAKNPKNRYADAREMFEDLKTALDESRSNEKRYVYKYPENDMDETKVLDEEVKKVKEEAKKTKSKTKTKEKVKSEKKEKVEEVLDEDFDDEPRSNKTLIIIVSIFTAIVLGITVFVLVYFGSTETEPIKVPDVSNMSVTDAANLLVEKGFDVEKEYKYEASETIEEGKVVRTEPPADRKVQPGSINSTITIYISSGEGTYIVEDFIGENYLEVKGKIEAKCECSVAIEKEKVSEDDKKKEDEVIKIVPAPGEASKLRETITIYIPDIEYKYPDFTDGFTMVQIEEFAEKHKVNLQIKYETDDSVAEGTILKQSREKDSVVAEGAVLVITVSKKSEIVETPDEDTSIEDNQDSENTGE